MKDLSIIVPLYNHEGEVVECINTLLKSIDEQMIILVIDDGSTDGGAEEIKKIFKNNKKVKLYQKRNGGLCSARNFGMAKAKSRYITFCDPDDTVNVKFNYRDLISQMEKYEYDYLIFNYNYKYIDKNVESINLNFPKGNFVLEKDDLAKLKASTLVSTINSFNIPNFDGCQFVCNKIYKLSIIKENNLLFNPNLKFSEDSIFNIKYLDHVDKTYITDINFYNYSVYSTNATNSYKKDILETYDAYQIEISHLLENGNEFDKEVYYARIFRNLTNCLKYKLYHKDNQKKDTTIRDVLNKYPYYKDSIRNLKFKSVTRKQKLLLLAFKLKLYFIVQLLSKLNR